MRDWFRRCEKAGAGIARLAGPRITFVPLNSLGYHPATERHNLRHPPLISNLNDRCVGKK
jgi:hypothetical protein